MEELNDIRQVNKLIVVVLFSAHNLSLSQSSESRKLNKTNIDFQRSFFSIDWSFKFKIVV